MSLTGDGRSRSSIVDGTRHGTTTPHQPASASHRPTITQHHHHLPNLIREPPTTTIIFRKSTRAVRWIHTRHSAVGFGLLWLWCVLCSRVDESVVVVREHLIISATCGVYCVLCVRCFCVCVCVVLSSARNTKKNQHVTCTQQERSTQGKAGKGEMICDHPAATNRRRNTANIAITYSRQQSTQSSDPRARRAANKVV